MKKFLLIILLGAHLVSFAQKKSKLTEVQVDSLKASNLTLYEENQNMHLITDSLQAALAKYTIMYELIRDKVILKEFRPEQIGEIIDSLRTSRDSIILASALLSASVRDSLEMEKRIADSLRIEVSGLHYAINLLRGSGGALISSPESLKGSFDLILRKIKVTGEAQKQALIDVSADPVPKVATFLDANSITRIKFIDGEFAELVFSNGEIGKCYYLVNDFSQTQPFWVDFKGTKADVRVYFMNSTSGTRISFQVPGLEDTYYFGMFMEN